MSKPDINNPDAFPVMIPNNYSRGMTLRDWFAGQALAGIMASPVYKGSPLNPVEFSYQLAEAMLEERKKQIT